MVKLAGMIGAALALGLGLGLGDGAQAKGWPTPAAGESASGGPEILFTFDDGPNPRTTPLVLDTLARHHIHAVFFMVGEMAENPSPKVVAVIRRVLREGHVIATHTMKHKDLCRVRESDAVRDLDDGKATVEQVAGVPTAWFRAPFGTRCDRLEHMLAERHLAHFHWDLDPQEWKHGNAARAVRYVTGELAHASGRNVLLMHDIKQATVKALPQILAWIDDENARREKSHKKPIRVVQAPALAVERLPPGLGAWLTDATGAARALPDALASVLP
ncbi:MAG TPA: polysaccharide deacetylase family protein [Kofleriaceae bacterium]|nr:polysaccharide deacetylase family protein [Kofleriaceae bacterium]